MANNYDKILELANANKMGLSNTIKRDFGIPLDYTSVQASYEAALTYAATNTLAYVGQPISVGDKLYIITAESQGKYPAEVEEGESQIDVFLAEVGSATEGDGTTIDLVDGVLSLHGIDGKLTGTYVPSLVNGILTWNVPDTSTAEGQQQAIDALETRTDAIELTLNGKAADEEAGTEAVVGLVDKVAANTKAISDEVTARETAIENITKAETGAIAVAVAAEAKAREDADKAINDKIGTVTEGKTVVGMISDVEAKIPTNNNQLTNGAGYQTANDVATAISGKADKATTLAGYGITDEYTKEEVDSAISAMTHMSTEVVAAPPAAEDAKPGVIYLVADDANAGTYVEYILVEYQGNKYVERIGTTATDLSDYATKTYVGDNFAAKEHEHEIADVTGLETIIKGTGLYFANLREGDNGKQVAEFQQDYDGSGFSYLTFEEGNHVVFSQETGHLTIGTDIQSATDSEEGLVTLKQITDAASAARSGAVADVEAKGYAVADTVNGELAKKIETAQIRHTSEGVGEGVTKDGTALTITVDAYRKSEVYTKSETDAAITAKINSVTGGESAADVKLSLEDYRDAVNTEIWGADAAKWTTKETGDDGKVTVTYTPQYGTTSRVDTLEAEVATLHTNVEKAQADATAAGTAVSTLEAGKVATNAANIATIQGQITGEGGLSARIGAIEAANSTHATEYANLKAKVDTVVDTTIPALTNRVAANESAIVTINNTLNGVEGSEGLIAVVAKKANAADVYTKGEVDAKVITSGEVVRGTTDSVAIANNKITVTLNSYTKTEVDNAIAAAVENIDTTAIDNAAADIAVLVGDDKNAESGRATKSIRTIAAEEVAKIVDGAPEALDTLAEIAAWIIDDNTGAAAVVEDIAKHEAILAGFGTDDGEVATVKKYVDDAIAAIPEFTLEVATADKLGGVKSATGDNKVTVADTGVMSVATVNVNTLTQTAGDVLILNGGSAAI